MTRDEFLENILDMDDLKRFGYDYGYEYTLEDVYDRDSYNGWVWDSIRDWCDDWESLATWLYNLPETNDGRWFDISDEPCVVGDYEFESWKDDMLERLDRDGFFENEEESFACDEMPVRTAPAAPNPADLERLTMLLAAY